MTEPTTKICSHPLRRWDIEVDTKDGGYVVCKDCDLWFEFDLEPTTDWLEPE